MENREYNQRKRRVLPSFITNSCCRSKKRRLNNPLIRENKFGNHSIPTKQNDIIPDDILKLIFKFNHLTSFSLDKSLLKYKFYSNQNLNQFYVNLDKFISKYNPLPSGISDIVTMIADLHQIHRLHIYSYPFKLHDIRAYLSNYLSNFNMIMRIENLCDCTRYCKSCTYRRLRIGYLTHILGKSNFLRSELNSSHRIQKELSLHYINCRRRHKTNHWVIYLYNDIMFNPSSNVYVTKW